MKKLKLFFALFAMLALGVGNAWGAEEATLTFTKACGGTGTDSKGNAWTVTSDAAESSYDATKGIHYGTGSKAVSYLQLSTSGISGTITKVEVNASGASGTTAKLNVTVGGLTFGTQKTLTSTATTYAFEGNAEGAIVVKLSQSSAKKALYVKSVIVTYETSGGEETVVKTLKSIAVSDMTTIYEQGDAFSFDGTCTATYSVTKDDVAQADETVEVTPTSVSEPDMTTIGTKEVTVTYTEGEITKTVPYEITVENALPKIVITQNEVVDFTNTYAEYTWTASGVSGKIYGYKNSGMQLNSTKDGSYVYNTDPIPGYIRKIKIVKAASGTTRNWTPYVSETALTSAEGTELTQQEVATITTWEVTGENSYFYLLESGGATVIESITIYYEAVVPQVAAPTFNPEAGTYNAVQNVTISAEEGATIHYTLDGQNPTTESPIYSTPIEIAETKTLKAIAVKDEKVSPVASATYTINLPLTTMDQIFAKATAVGSTATSVEITFGNWVVSAVKEDGKTAFVTDGTKGFVIFDKDVNLGFSVGNTLSGTAACKVQLYNGFAELTSLTSATTGLTVTTGGTITTQELDATGIAALTGVNTGSLIKINGTCTSESSKYYVADVQIYTSLYDFGTLEVGAEYNITGIYQQYHSTKEMLPRSAADIEKVVGLPTATISIADITMEIGQEKTIEATITPDAAQSTVQYAITAGSEFITLNGTTITAIAAGTATITATIAEVAGAYNGATKTFTVTVKPQNIAILPFTFNGGKADIENTLGMSQTGLDDDYGSAPKLKFNGAGDNVIVHFDSQAGEFSFVLKQNGQNAGTFTIYESANGEDYTPVWSGGDFGNTQSETIKPTLSESARYVKFEYTTKGISTNYALGSISIAKPDDRQDAGLAWNPETVTLTVGDAFTAPTLSYPHSVSGINYESSNDEVATVTTEGVIALGSATGTATITATFEGDATYKPATATCIITVNECIETIDGEWQLVTDAATLKAGDKVIVAQYVETDGAIYTMGGQKTNNRDVVESTVFGTTLTPTTGTSVLTLVDAGNGTFAMQASNGNYLYAASSGSNHLKEKDEIDVNGQWTITIADSKATIKAEGSANRNLMCYNSSNKLFSCYASTNPQQDIALYKKMPDYTRDVTPGNLGTICLPSNVPVGQASGATFYTLAGKDANGRIAFDEVTGELVAGKSYLFQANAAKIVCYYGTTSVLTPDDSGAMKGTFVDLELDGSDLTDIYYFAKNALWSCVDRTELGLSVPANRAYVNMAEVTAITEPAPVGVRRITLGVNGQNTATGVDQVQGDNVPTKMIINGQLFILRGEKMYDAQGKLVK